MTQQQTHPSPFPGKIGRRALIELVETAIQLGEYRFARRAALNWLSGYPGDLQVSILQIKAFVLGGGSKATAREVIQQLVARDPEFIEAYQFGIDLAGDETEPEVSFYRNCLIALGVMRSQESASNSWAVALRLARAALSRDNLETAEKYLLPVISANPPTPLPAITHALILKQWTDRTTNQTNLVNLKILQHYADRWGKCLQIRLLLAEALMEGGEPDQGVALLHDCMAEDPAGQVVSRLYGKDHAYAKLWPEKIEYKFDLALPASLAARYGMNLLADPYQRTNLYAPVRTTPVKDSLFDPSPSVQLPDQENHLPKNSGGVAETLHPTRQVLEKLARKINQPEIMRSDGRFPVYVILSSKQGLIGLYGVQGYNDVKEAIERFQKIIQQKRSWNAITLWVDDPTSTGKLKLKPVLGSDPWAIKRLLGSVDQALAARGEMIGAVLIVGGPEIIPFHQLPNPVDDLDLEIPSDNPYACLDENYFVPEWPVGRLPGDARKDSTALINAIQVACENHAPSLKTRNWFQRFIHWMQTHLRLSQPGEQRYFAYTAAIWRKASESVLKGMANPESFVISPPASAGMQRRHGKPIRFAYFNLHGISEAPEWFGHKDPVDHQNSEDYPVALSPGDIHQLDQVPAVVLSEACYGAFFQRSHPASDAIPLSFLARGTGAFIGSTSTSYGGVASPLIAADLLSRLVWLHIRTGKPVGEALRQAKIDLIQEMDRRQGFLDGEDQKTLISFILYGDPLMMPGEVTLKGREVRRIFDKPEVNTVCAKSEVKIESPLHEPSLDSVRSFVAKYLPGMQDARLSINQPQPECNGTDHTCPSGQLHLHAKGYPRQNRRVVTMSKTFRTENRTHTQFAHLTLDNQGKVIKACVSR
jgi:hypothetical protein